MPVIILKTEIASDIETVFDLSRSIDLHRDSTSATNERAVAGRTSGLIDMGETVTWEANHFYHRQRLTVRIEQFDRPNHFRDTMLSGAFSRFDHDHNFQSTTDETLMTDAFDFTSPFCLIGRLPCFADYDRLLRIARWVRVTHLRHASKCGSVQRVRWRMDPIPGSRSNLLWLTPFDQIRGSEHSRICQTSGPRST